MEVNQLVVMGTTTYVTGITYVIKTYTLPHSPVVNEVKTDGTVIAQITLLPRSAGCGFMYSDSRTVTPGMPPQTVSRALISVDAKEPILYISRITDLPVLLQPMSTALTITMDAPGIPPRPGHGSISASHTLTASDGSTTIVALSNSVNRRSGLFIAAMTICAALAVLIVVVGVYMTLRLRRKRMKKSGSDCGKESNASQTSNATVVDPHEAFRRLNGYTPKKELSGDNSRQELEYSPIAPRELQGHPQVVERSSIRSEDSISSLRPKPLRPRRPECGLDTTAGRKTTTSAPSPHAESQRKRELQWLEMEEARIRQRRDHLLQQARSVQRDADARTTLATQ